MSTENVFIQIPTSSIEENRFNWTYDREPTAATTARCYVTSHLGSPGSWNFLGMTGTDEEGDVHGYLFSIYQTGDLIEQTFTLEDGLFMRFFKSHKVGNAYGRLFTSPDSAELALRLDPITGIALGDYKALFKSDPEARLAPSGTFKLNLYGYESLKKESSEEIYRLHAELLWK